MTDDEPNPWARIVGPCHTVASMARTLERTETEVVEAGGDLRLLMLHTSDDVYLFPSFQLQDGNIVEGLQEVLRVLETGTASRWTWAQWLNVALPEENPPRNITLLYDGQLEEALRGARHVAWSWSS
ncbi:hypothetical protein FIV50_08590 [Microbacterium foliorum]|uniref:Uncharacterized protein n=1 Tax=Microbacterium foliorum TaxID=104336 RepID=A0A4Y5YQS7_9MICO|nr:hypothetical protein [Microbacterium foliorum]QDE34845.1 hypothetical protein FIV50_08590 [Microbacterium foliorum]